MASKHEDFLKDLYFDNAPQLYQMAYNAFQDKAKASYLVNQVFMQASAQIEELSAAPEPKYYLFELAIKVLQQAAQK